jgi:drug/metabolite transporter (DMT)-like permease
MHFLGLALLSALGWGLSPIVDRYNLNYITSWDILTSRALVFGILGIIIGLTAYKFKALKIKKAVKDKGSILILTILLSPLLGYMLGHTGLYLALGQAKSSITTIILFTHCIPVIIVAILSTCIYGDKINFKMITGIFLALLGISMVVIYNPNHGPLRLSHS